MGWNYLSIPKLQWCSCWSLELISKLISHFTKDVVTYPHWNLKLVHANKIGPMESQSNCAVNCMMSVHVNGLCVVMEKYYLTGHINRQYIGFFSLTKLCCFISTPVCTPLCGWSHDIQIHTQSIAINALAPFMSKSWATKVFDYAG